MNRTGLLTTEGYDKPNYFQRRAVGDGRTDDGPVLNSILDRAANMPAIVFILYGVYVIKDTLHVPIMAKGPKFENELEPRVAVQVGKPSDVGVVEIQSMMFTSSGPTAGAILMEWNVHEYSQGAVGMWDSHFRVGGAAGPGLQSSQCPKTDGTVREQCKGASLLLHFTPQSSAYLENIWAWTADHDMEKSTQDQISVYSARGILVESQGPTWMYGTASEHNVLYQYQVSGAKNLYMGMIQTETPYFQPGPKAPHPFSTGLFPNDPDFTACSASSVTCAVSWALRVIDSTSVYVMGAGLYSLFSNYNQDCLDTGNCQQHGVEISQSTDTWLYNLVTKGVVEMVSPVNEEPTLAADNVNGFASSTLAWVRGEDDTIGERKFSGFQLYKTETLQSLHLTDTCVTALSEKILCSDYLYMLRDPGIGQYIEDSALADITCDAGCGASLKRYYDNVAQNCGNQTVGSSKPTKLGGTVYANYNMTCLKDPSTNRYCTTEIVGFTTVDSVSMMPRDEMCSYCYTSLLQMRQASPYAAYSDYDREALQTVHAECGLSGPTDPHKPLDISTPPLEPMCVSEITYTTEAGDTCDSIARQYSVASAAVIYGNPTLLANCSALAPNRDLCIPLSCETQYEVADADDCWRIEYEQGLIPGVVRKYNNWLDSDCLNLQSAREILGSILCLSPQGGKHTSAGNSITTAPTSTGYVNRIVKPPEGAAVAAGTTMHCGAWHTAEEGDSCVEICLDSGMPSSLFRSANPSLAGGDCNAELVAGQAYCVGPHPHWDDDAYWA
ncbi:hypothetical protein BDW74DRAFT_169519 [Aspergillus multicolor]|uniref:putative 1,3-beta glucanase n=1 Tax=Aspergillus multicolor TaxID=41759 RepID=UPI003CCDCEC5